MTAEFYSGALVSQIALSDKQYLPQGYYRSKLFIFYSATNPLVAAASPLLSLLERLNISPTLPPVAEIRHNIEHEIHAFHSRLISQQYGEESIAIARYLLSATIDELLGKNYMRIYGAPPEFKAFTPSSHVDEGPQKRFFHIIDFLKERTNQYLDLIELAYYCLITGFEGDCHMRADGRCALDNLIEELYQLIQLNRVNKSYKIFKEEQKPLAAPVNYKPYILSVSLGVLLLGAIYFCSYFWLDYKAKSLVQGYSHIATMDS
ncbi:type IVB secretion system protein IcmH/DotU [Legionella londiniensis]|uniref:IcmH (DotU) n=1 Tax=Legionella londiniensis TaxID=45068 RepID=A0A0W0VMQ5_9GAMM|nr:type IVB secretion system protein IcmH/DotU [Legionella londiniensis]KTD21315.1 IcmH (DotU) [Legionella londiniensis]STX93629.1 IcmH (DotU) [Legionella londiniensis]